MKILALGDSLTYAYLLRRKEAWPSLLEEKLNSKVTNAGISGDSTAGMLTRYPILTKEDDFSNLILMGGTNDLFAGLSWRIPYSNLRSIFMQALGKRQKILLINPPNLYLEDFEREREDFMNQSLDKLGKELETLAKDHGQKYLSLKELLEEENPQNFYLDGVHLNKLGNELLAESIFKLLL